MKSEKIIFNILLIFLAIHLIYSNNSLLLDMGKMIDKNQFINLGLSESEATLKAIPDMFTIISKLIFAISYSIITVTLIYLYPRIVLISLVALMDGFGIYLKYNINQDYFIELSAIYFGIYTAIIVITSGLIRNYNKKTGEERNEKTIDNLNNTQTIIEETNNLNAIDIKKQLRSIQCKINATKDPQKLQTLIETKEELLNHSN